MRHLNRRLKIALLVFAASLIYFLSYAGYGLTYDEGYLLDGVKKVMEGQVIYRDFHHTYAPGRFYLLAVLFKAFGQNILVERAVFAVLQALKCSFAFLIVSAVTPGAFAYLAPLLVLIAPGPWHKVFFSSMGFAATYFAIRAVGRGPLAHFACGVAIGVCGVFRQDVAGFAMVGALAGLVIETLRLRRSARSSVAALAAVVAGAAVIATPVAAYFWSQGALGAMVRKIAVDGMLDNATNRIPFPPIYSKAGVGSRYLVYILPVKALFYLPLLCYAVSLFLLARVGRRGLWSEGHTRMAVVLAVAVLAFSQSTLRADIGHLLQTMQFAYLLVALLLARGAPLLERRLGGSRRLASVATWTLPSAACLGLLWATLACVRASADVSLLLAFRKEGLETLDTEYLGSAAVRVGNTAKLDLDRVPVRVTPGEARFFSEVKRFLERSTSPDEYVLALPQLQVLYFFYDRRNPTRYAHYRRRIPPEEEERYIADIEAHGTRYILLTEPFEGARIGRTSESFSQYASRVRTWILANYSEVGRIGAVRILQRNP